MLLLLLLLLLELGLCHPSIQPSLECFYQLHCKFLLLSVSILIRLFYLCVCRVKAQVKKKDFLAFSTQFIFSIIRLVPTKEVMVTIYMFGKSPITQKSRYMELRENIYYFLCFSFIYLFVSLFNNNFTFLYLQCLICVS